MKHLAILTLAMAPLAGLAADLTIPAGKTYVVGIDQQELVLENLRIGDGAKITFSSAVVGWRVQARHAYIGSGVVVDGNGSAGMAGDSAEATSVCADGGAGGNGGDGSDGVEIRLQLGIESFGDIQVMSAGTGIVHSEFNEEDVTTKIFQIWIIPRSQGGKPRWETKSFPRGDQAGILHPLASGRVGITGVAPIDQDATLFAGTLPKGTVIDQILGRNRSAYLVPAKGRVKIDGTEIKNRDGVIIRDAKSVKIEALEDAEVILVDVPNG